MRAAALLTLLAAVGCGRAATGPSDGGAAADGAACAPECPAGSSRCASATETSACTLGDDGCARRGAALACPQGTVCSDGVSDGPCAPAETRCLDDATLQTCTAGQLTREVSGLGCDPITKACRACTPGRGGARRGPRAATTS
jgi:hypothetical protein